MSLYKRGNTWWIRFTTPNGQRIRQSAGTGDRKKAQEYHDRLKAKVWETTKLGVKPERSWQEATVRWLKETSHKADQGRDKEKLRWLDQFLGGLMLSEINRDLIDAIILAKEKEGRASGTINRYLALIRAILRKARDEWEWIDHIPKIKLRSEPRRRVRWLTPMQARQLIDHLPQHLADMVRFTLATGLRQSNVSYLRWDQVDMSREIAWIHADQAKARKAIVVPLNGDAMQVLKERQGINEQYVFTFRDKPVQVCTTKAWKRALKKANIEDFRWHDLRHTWASWHVQNGTSLQELMELGGWSSYEMVLRYAHLAGEHLKGAASRVSGTILAHS
ncbi:MAG: site-specific integrase [Gammaproteobacteria bacterium]|nr:MAG: site-specific integrase [Gammaproteobacteria bacterium]